MSKQITHKIIKGNKFRKIRVNYQTDSNKKLVIKRQ